MPTLEVDEEKGKPMDTNKDDNMILSTQEPKTVNSTQKNDTEENNLVGVKDSMLEEAHIDTSHPKLNNVDEVTREKNISGRLMFLNKSKLKVNITFSC